ncbi:MAG: cupin domain-containing protein [Phycisphaerales bacterium]|nr:cupin domain-containing protein [Phycisphaerales bacterium]
MTYTIHRWDTLAVDHPMDLIDRRRVIGERMMISHVTLHRGFRVAPHRHDNEQITVLLSGRLRFTLGEEGATEIRDMVAGEVLHLPGDVRHGAEALETCVVLDLFSPVSQTTGVDARSGD